MYSIDTEDLPVTPTTSMDPEAMDAGGLVKAEGPGSAERPAASGGGSGLMMTGDGARDAAAPMEGAGLKEELASDAAGSDGASAAGASMGTCVRMGWSGRGWGGRWGAALAPRAAPTRVRRAFPTFETVTR